MDAYLALTPFLVLGIIGLVRFIGCNWIWDLEPTVAEVKPVDALEAEPADRRVELTWTYLSTENITGFRVDVTGGDADAVPPLGASARSVTVTGLTNGTLYTFSVVAERGTDASAAAIIQATPGVTSFVKDDPPITGMARNNYSGFVGMEIMVGPNPIRVTQLGRIVAPSNSGVHQVKIVSPVTTPEGQPVDGIDVVSTNVTTIAQLDGSNIGKFEWTPLPQPVTLEANKIYFVVSAEMTGGDLWYEQQPLQTTAVAALLFSTNTLPPGDPDAGKYGRPTMGQGLAFVPVSFRY